MRRLVAIGLAFSLMAGAVGAATGQEAGDEKDRQGRSFGTEKQIILSPRFIPIVRTDLTRLEIDWVVLADGATTRIADARLGVQQEDQDKIDLSFLPILGKAVGARYTARDVAPETRVGSVYLPEGLLVVALDPARAAVTDQTQIVVLNKSWAFTLTVPAKIMDLGEDPAFDPIRDTPALRDLAETKVILPDAQSILIGGLERSDTQEQASKIPGLGDIPTLGRMFAGSAHQTDTDKLIILIRPSIIVSDE